MIAEITRLEVARNMFYASLHFSVRLTEVLENDHRRGQRCNYIPFEKSRAGCKALDINHI